MNVYASLCLSALLVLLASCRPADTGQEVVPNDNRTPAGELRDGVLTLRLEARQGTWHPQGPDGPGFPIEAFGEPGKPLQAPGPLIRVPVGTEVRVSLRNVLERPVLVRGLHDRAPAARDSFDLPAGQTREVRFRATVPGTFYYWGRTVGERRGFSPFEDGQLLGALVVDPPAGPAAARPAGPATPAAALPSPSALGAADGAPEDRILVIALWVHREDAEAQREHVRHTFLVNGLSWPFTERLQATVGGSVRWRVINASVAPHPMHLHGFYFQVEGRGDAWADTLYTEKQTRLSVTENMSRGTTLAMSWLPKRAGNWLFHCHFIAHIHGEQHVREPGTLAAAVAAGAVHEHAYEGMAGLVSGIVVTDPRGVGLREDESAQRRRLRLYANVRERHFGDHPAFSFILQEGPEPPAPDSLSIPGTTLVLVRDEPVEVLLVNRTPQPVSVHWHGIELDSYYDGVAGWSGIDGRIAPMVAAGDSFAVRFTPDRAGTFIYHTHMEESEQLSSGLYGPLIVLEPGQAYEPDADRIFLLGWGGPGPEAPPFLNGSAEPPPVRLERGNAYRFRFINITPSNNQRVRLLRGERPVEWRRYGKDGADVPPHQAVSVEADQFLGAGETYDFEVSADDPGSLTLEVTTFMGRRPPVTMEVPVRIR